jgi:NADH-quinone oxidoreductase subunit B
MEDAPQTTAGPPVFATAWDRILDWARRMDVRPVRLGLGCCGFALLPGLDPRHDLARFGPAVFRSRPGRGGLLVVAGPVNGKMAPLVRRLWDGMPDPKWAIALGGCAGPGGAGRTYAVAGGLDRAIPVDVHVPGCPPGPEALLEGLRALEARIGAPEAAP